jgi:hypothetical protein
VGRSYHPMPLETHVARYRSISLMLVRSGGLAPTYNPAYINCRGLIRLLMKEFSVILDPNRLFYACPAKSRRFRRAARSVELVLSLSLLPNRSSLHPASNQPPLL